MGFHHALSGLNAASKSLDVTGHNIANSSTIGFKRSRAEFNEMVASAMGVGGSCSRGGNGIGVSIAAVSQQFTQGVITPTPNNLDMAINGDGFFVVNTPDGVAYTRNGAFQLDKNGYLVTANGDKVQGWADANATGGVPQDLRFPVASGTEGQATTQVAIESANLPATAQLGAGDPTATPPIPETPRHTYGTSINIYDSLGVSHSIEVYFVKTGADTWEVYDQLDDPSANPPVTATSIGTLNFDPATGKLPPGTTVTATAHNSAAGGGTAPSVAVDLSGMTQTGRGWSVDKMSQDGFESGQLTGVSVSKDGTLMASYSNGTTRPEGKVALARFTNPQGLAPSGNNNWVQTSDSGPVLYGSGGSGSFGHIEGCALEESNVDLTAELVGMMTAQRAYQANAQTIKTQDQVFSTLINLR